MFKQIANVAQLMKQAQAMQGRLHDLQRRLAELRVTGTAGNGLVEVDAAGDQRIVAVRIQEEARSAGTDRLEQLIVAATNDALDRAKQAAAGAMQSATDDLGPLAGLLAPSDPSN